MMREANGAMRLLLQMQAARRKLEADHVLGDRAARTEHVATHLMAAALPGIRRHPNQPAAPAPAEAGANRAADPVPERNPAAAAAAEEPEPDPVAEAEHYAVIYPERAALIRGHGRVPDNVTFGPPDDHIVQALVTANTPALSALDHACAAACPMPRHGARAA